MFFSKALRYKIKRKLRRLAETAESSVFYTIGFASAEETI